MPSRADLEQRLQFEELLADLSTRFINLPADRVDEEIQDSQRRVCDLLGFELSALWQRCPDDPEDFYMTHLYRAFDGPPIPQPMKAKEHWPWMLSRLLNGETVVIESTEDTPPEAAKDREQWRAYEVKNALALPMSVGEGEVIGVVSFNQMSQASVIAEDAIRRLKTVAHIFANAIARKTADLKLRESEERLSLAADAAGIGLWKLDLTSQRFWVTPRTREMFGFEPDEEISLDHFLERVQPEDRPGIHRVIAEMIDSGRTGTVEYRVSDRDGLPRWYVSRGSTQFDSSGRPLSLTGVSVDITDRKEAEQVSRDFGGRLIQAHEEERARVSRELHDDFTQRLARLAIDVGQLGVDFVGGDPSRDRIDRIQEDLATVSEDVHSLAYRLHPSLLTDLGLEEALRIECTRWEDQLDHAVMVEACECPEVLPAEHSLCLFRIAQEGLRNVARHAGSSSASLVLQCSAEAISLEISDDGIGFDTRSGTHQATLGMRGMRERAHLLGGAFEVESTEGQGTTLRVRLPLPPTPEAPA